MTGSVISMITEVIGLIKKIWLWIKRSLAKHKETKVQQLSKRDENTLKSFIKNNRQNENLGFSSVNLNIKANNIEESKFEEVSKISKNMFKISKKH